MRVYRRDRGPYAEPLAAVSTGIFYKEQRFGYLLRGLLIDTKQVVSMAYL